MYVQTSCHLGLRDILVMPGTGQGSQRRQRCLKRQVRTVFQPKCLGWYGETRSEDAVQGDENTKKSVDV